LAFFKLGLRNGMTPETFSTRSLPRAAQFDVWRGWYGSVFEATAPEPQNEGFDAANSNWVMGGLTVSHVASPPSAVDRKKSLIRRHPVDHWALTLSMRSASDVEVGGVSLEVPPEVPFFLSLGEEMHISRRQQDERVQVLLSRDGFSGIARILDGVTGMAVNTAQGRLLADYTLLLARNLPNLAAEEAARLPKAVETMFAACLAPSADKVEAAGHQINLTLMERVRRAVRRHLRSPSLGPERLCREAGASRSTLYRLLESEGGVGRYIQRQRLSESFAILGDASNTIPIGMIAETLCFADASSFSRAFRREFGITPSDLRVASLSGVAPAIGKKAPASVEIRSFGDCLRSF
jgi:AraC-like DNA-binding protein